MTILECENLLKQTIIRLIEETIDSNKSEYEERFSKVIGVFKVENNNIWIIIKDALSKLMIEKFCLSRMNQILQEISNQNLRFNLIIENDALEEKNSNNNKLIAPDIIKSDRVVRKLRSEFTFDNFVIGESNRFAFVSSMKVAESTHAILNPLYIFGDVGLGKTHLMMAIGHYKLDKDANCNVVYTSAQQFTEDYFIYTKKDPKNIEFFYDKYKTADMLLVDDIQFLENKTATQEEFFKVFDYLHENNKQIVVTSDRMAADLKLMERLKSRFSWGLPVDVKSPNKELRVNILKRKLDFLLPNPSDVPLECLEKIADLFTNNIRELEGALRRYVTYCVSLDVPFTIENVENILKDIIPSNSYINSSPVDEKIKKVKEVVCNYFQISEEDLTSQRRNSSLVYARNLCFYIIKEKCNLSLKRISDIFNKKDHTSIAHGYDKIKESLKEDIKVKNDINYIIEKLDN